MRTSILLTAALALAACNGAQNGESDALQTDQASGTGSIDVVDSQADAGFEAIAPGNYEVERADGSIEQLTVLPGMTWATVFSDGEAAGGTIFAQGGKNCFVTEGVEEHQCFEGNTPAADGSLRVTADDGEVMTVRPVETFA